MKIIYLDQNKWIDLARAVKYPEDMPRARAVLEVLCHEVKTGRVLVPLTSANIYETHKVNRIEQRLDLAYCQTTLSGAHFFRGRHQRLEVEVIDAVRRAYGLAPVERERYWFLSNVFFEATAEWDDPRIAQFIPENAVEAIRNNPQHWFFHYLVETPEDARRAAVERFSKGSDMLRQDIEGLRHKDTKETLSTRRKIKNARLMLNDLDQIKKFIAKADVPDVPVDEVLWKHGRRIMNDTPAYVIEREMTLKIDMQTRAIHENDFRDMANFCAVLPYADIVVAENQFADLARQAGLGRRFNTIITPDLSALKEHLG